MFKNQEKKLVIVCVAVAVVMLYAFIKSVIRFLRYY